MQISYTRAIDSHYISIMYTLTRQNIKIFALVRHFLVDIIDYCYSIYLHHAIFCHVNISNNDVAFALHN